MTKKPRGRLYQESAFIFDEFNGLKLEQLIVCENSKLEPILVYIKVKNRNWHQYFLDAGIGFWENWDELIDVEDDEEFKHLDYTDKLKLKGKRISKIYCTKDLKNSRIVIEFKNKEKLILKCVNPEILDSQCELIKIE
ncbi:hypothetical protein [Aquimarina litoralis]|uniref:hypothetical protein n=1 Tax=Aquimarina litoralis TaxID=584605 RepID=UPI001C573676|nr:hypothetical protein [Aquimarina litoralis]MBW1296327.1 hypothetical protein [Aquimarina litoralis]